MRRTPRIATAALAGLAIVLALAPGCASRKKVTTAQVEPPPPAETKPEAPPPATETQPPAPPTEERLSLQDAYFDFDDFSLRSDAKSALTNNGMYMERNSGATIVIEGHCDERGSVEYNLALGEKRAKAAKEFLVSYGVPSNRMTTISYGKERPFDPGHDEEAWAKNRRAHFVVK
jgi:peptidoglycan-associated lipoprotein